MSGGTRVLQVLGSTGCYPVVRGSLPRTPARSVADEYGLGDRADCNIAAERLSAATGWHPVLPGKN